MVSRTVPSRIVVCTWSIPAMLLSDCSVGSATEPFNSSGLAPGRLIKTWTTAGSALGSRSTLRSRKENNPVTTKSVTSMVVKTGRLTQNSAMDMTAYCKLRLLTANCLLFTAYLHPIGELLDVGRDDLRAGIEALRNLDAVAEAVAENDFLAEELAVLHHEHAIG